MDRRTDYDLLRQVCEVLNREYEGSDRRIGFWYGTNEDYGLDIMSSGYTDSGMVAKVPFEVKGISGEYGSIRNRFYYETAGRNGAWRYGLTGDTGASQSDIENDRTPMPDFLKEEWPLNVLNACDIFGDRENGKVGKLVSERGGLIYAHEGGLMLYTHSDLMRAIRGYAWQRLRHTKFFENRGIGWELKAMVDMDRFTRDFCARIDMGYLER